MLEQVRWGLQLPPPNLKLPNGVDDIGECVIIHYINYLQGGEIDQQVH